VSALGLKLDNSNGKYDSAHLTFSIVFRAVLEVIGKQRASTCSSRTTHGKVALLKEFLQVNSNPDYVVNSVIVYNGQHIRVQALLSAAGLHIDSATGKYDTHSLTAVQLYETIQQFISTTQNATTYWIWNHNQDERQYFLYPEFPLLFWVLTMIWGLSFFLLPWTPTIIFIYYFLLGKVSCI
jgi:hypothetical protein